MPDASRVCPTCGTSYPSRVLYCPDDGTELGAVAADPYIGVEIAGLFEPTELVGTGSMARVYRAIQRDLGRNVAVKILHRDLIRDETIVARFFREARVAGRLAHPNILHVITAATLPTGGPQTHGEPFLVSEYLDGRSLKTTLEASDGILSLERALHVVVQVSDATGEAHAQGVVHRDLKPENVMLVQRGADPDFVKLVDFGVARDDSSEDSVETRAGSLLGTARYMSPEGARGERVEPPGDVYAIATLLFQCLCGRTPFEGDNPVTLLIQHARNTAPDVRTVRGGERVPEPIARLIGQNLLKDPLERSPDARTFGRELVEAALQSGVPIDRLDRPSTLLGAATPPRQQQDANKPGAARALKRWLLPAIVIALSLGAKNAAAAEKFEYLEPDREMNDAWFGMAEFGVGVLSLPTAEVCVQSSSGGCSKGDLSLAVSAWPLFRYAHVAIGAGVSLGLTPTTDAPPNSTPDLPRDHNRSYYTVEITGRYYLDLTETLEGWLGVTGGLVVVNDTFQSQSGLSDRAQVGPQGVTILTEGWTAGIATGVAFAIAENWRLGGGVRFANWFLPSKPETDPLGDEASLRGSVMTIELGLSLAYRSRLVF